jgi:hypothetical protein
MLSPNTSVYETGMRFNGLILRVQVSEPSDSTSRHPHREIGVNPLRGEAG